MYKQNVLVLTDFKKKFVVSILLLITSLVGTVVETDFILKSLFRLMLEKIDDINVQN